MKKDYSKNDYLITSWTFNRARAGKAQIFYNVYRFYSSGRSRLIHDQEEIDWVISNHTNQACRVAGLQ